MNDEIRERVLILDRKADNFSEQLLKVRVWDDGAISLAWTGKLAPSPKRGRDYDDQTVSMSIEEAEWALAALGQAVETLKRRRDGA